MWQRLHELLLGKLHEAELIDRSRSGNRQLSAAARLWLRLPRASTHRALSIVDTRRLLCHRRGVARLTAGGIGRRIVTFG